MTSRDRSENCILTILKEVSEPLTTTQLLDHTSRHPKLCVSCKSAGKIMIAAMRLFRKGRISREISRGGFLWKMN